MTEKQGSNVHLGADWLARWLPTLGERELAAYLHLAHAAPRRALREPDDLRPVLPGHPLPEVRQALDRLEAQGLLETFGRDGKLHVHLPCVDAAGVHHAVPCRPSLKEALKEQRQVIEELINLAGQDETEALRQKVFARYPALRDEYDLWREQGDPDLPAWRLWMELSIYLMARFDERYAALKAEHGELFKEASGELLRLKLDMLDRIVEDLLARPDEIFRERGDGWVAPVSQSSFEALPWVRELARKFGFGPEQLYVNFLEVAGGEGKVICDLDDDGKLRDIILPSTTGLAENEEHIAFFGRLDGDATPEQIGAAKAKYAEYLAARGADTLIAFEASGRVSDADAILESLAAKITEAVELLDADEPSPNSTIPLGVPFVRRIYEQRRRLARKG